MVEGLMLSMNRKMQVQLGSLSRRPFFRRGSRGLLLNEQQLVQIRGFAIKHPARIVMGHKMEIIKGRQKTGKLSHTPKYPEHPSIMAAASSLKSIFILYNL